MMIVEEKNLKNTLENFFRRTLLCLSFLFICIGISGCASEEDIYYYVNDQMQQLEMGAVTNASKMTFREWAYNSLVVLSDNVKAVFPYIVLACWAVTVLIYALVKKEASLRKKALFSFGIIIPGIAFAVVWALSVLPNMFR